MRSCLKDYRSLLHRLVYALSLQSRSRRLRRLIESHEEADAAPHPSRQSNHVRGVL